MLISTMFPLKVGGACTRQDNIRVTARNVNKAKGLRLTQNYINKSACDDEYGG